MKLPDSVKLPTWDQLARFGKSRAVKSSYFWFLLVPILARWTSLLNDHLTFHVFGAELKFHVGLPFSWYAFFFAALAFAAGTAVFQFACPLIVREHDTYAEFLAAGKGSLNLTEYAEDAAPDFKAEVVARKKMIVDDSATADVARQNRGPYWEIRKEANHARRFARGACGLCYGLGFVLMGIVAAQSCWYVIRLLNS